jgi:hypothetical protein
VEGLFGEHFEGAMGNFTIFRWILFAAISLSLIRNDDLNMSFGT